VISRREGVLVFRDSYFFNTPLHTRVVQASEHLLFLLHAQAVSEETFRGTFVSCLDRSGVPISSTTLPPSAHGTGDVAVAGGRIELKFFSHASPTPNKLKAFLEDVHQVLRRHAGFAILGVQMPTAQNNEQKYEANVDACMDLPDVARGKGDPVAWWDPRDATLVAASKLASSKRKAWFGPGILLPACLVADAAPGARDGVALQIDSKATKSKIHWLFWRPQRWIARESIIQCENDGYLHCTVLGCPEQARLLIVLAGVAQDAISEIHPEAECENSLGRKLLGDIECQTDTEEPRKIAHHRLVSVRNSLLGITTPNVMDCYDLRR
jgi:hypothetical protein